MRYLIKFYCLIYLQWRLHVFPCVFLYTNKVYIYGKKYSIISSAITDLFKSQVPFGCKV